MPKPLLQMDEESRAQLKDIPESGMSYYFVFGRFNNYSEAEFHIIAGEFFIFPLAHPTYFSLEDLRQLPETGETIPSEPGRTVFFQIATVLTSGARIAAPSNVTLPPGYQPAFGAIHLLGTTTLQFPTNFYRFIGTSTDPRLQGNILKSGTYLSTRNDHGYANTGFGAVGRYALPIPVPACHLFIYQLPAGTVLKVGTVLPNFGQAGGGVEVQLTQHTTVPTPQYIKLDEY
jgi:hypothetical protein